jgi:hypothetical protein
MDDGLDFLDAAGSDEGAPSTGAPDAAATPDAAEPGDMPDLFSFLMDGGDPPAHDAAPDEGDAEEADPLAADDDPYAADADEDEDEPESLEDKVARLEAQNAEYLQAKREADAQAEETNNRAYWLRKETEVDGKAQQAAAWLAARLEAAYDKDAVIRDDLPYVIENYKRELKELNDEKLQAVWDVARKHGTKTYAQDLQARHGLNDADMQRIGKYPPEMWEDIAADLLEVRERDVTPVKRELTATKGQLTKAQRANRRARHDGMPAPPNSGRTTVIDFDRAKKAITPDNADEIAGRLFAALGIGP